MNHARASRLLSAYIDEELSPDEMAAIGGHLADCPGCRAEIQELRATKRLLGSLGRPEMPPGFAADTWSRVAPQARPRLLWWPVRLPHPATAIAVLVLVLAMVTAPAIRGHQVRLRAAEVGPDLFLQRTARAQAGDPLADRAFLGLVFTDASLRLIGEDPREAAR